MSVGLFVFVHPFFGCFLWDWLVKQMANKCKTWDFRTHAGRMSLPIRCHAGFGSSLNRALTWICFLSLRYWHGWPFWPCKVQMLRVSGPTAARSSVWNSWGAFLVKMHPFGRIKAIISCHYWHWPKIFCWRYPKCCGNSCKTNWFV